MLLRAAALLVPLTLLAALLSRWAPGETPLGLRIDGDVIAPTASVDELVAARSDAWGEREVLIELGPLTEVRARAELGASLDGEALRATLTAMRDATGLGALDLALRGYRGVLERETTTILDDERLRDAVDELAVRFDRAPRAAVMGADGRLLESPEHGRSLDREGALDVLREALSSGRRHARLPILDRAPDALPFETAVPLARIGAYHTRYRARGDEGPRATNVRRAAELLDGATIPSGGHLSFNDRVGPRTLDRGFRVAHVIERGEMVDGIGGGVCQVASTLHAAAFVAGLPIVEARPHTRPLPYIPMGLDATVAFGAIDLVIANPLSVPISIRAHAEGGALDVELWARASPAEVTWDRDVLERLAWDERVELDPSLPIGTEVVVEDGGPGFSLLRIRTIVDARGARTERERVHYPPTTRIVRRGAPDAVPLIPAEPAPIDAVPPLSTEPPS